MIDPREHDALEVAMRRFVSRHRLEAQTGLAGWLALDYAISHKYGESDVERHERLRLNRLWSRIESRVLRRMHG